MCVEKLYKSLLTFVMEKIRVNKIVRVLKIAQLPVYVFLKKRFKLNKKGTCIKCESGMIVFQKKERSTQSRYK